MACAARRSPLPSTPSNIAAATARVDRGRGVLSYRYNPFPKPRHKFVEAHLMLYDRHNHGFDLAIGDGVGLMTENVTALAQKQVYRIQRGTLVAIDKSVVKSEGMRKCRRLARNRTVIPSVGSCDC